MKAFVSWSGGKDCMFALYKFLSNKENEAVCLVNMCNDEGDRSRSHGISKHLIKAQADAMNLKITQEPTNFKGYETAFKSVIEQLKKDHHIEAGVFGDIYLQAHKDWIERVCSEMGIQPVFPLWHQDTQELLSSFIQSGFKTITVAVDHTKLSKEWLGRVIDQQFLNEITLLEEIDPCAENGEYHSFVFDGPLFQKALNLTIGSIRDEGNNSFQEIELSTSK